MISALIGIPRAFAGTQGDRQVQHRGGSGKLLEIAHSSFSSAQQFQRVLLSNYITTTRRSLSQTIEDARGLGHSLCMAQLQRFSRVEMGGCVLLDHVPLILVRVRPWTAAYPYIYGFITSAQAKYRLQNGSRIGPRYYRNRDPLCSFASHAGVP